MVSDYSTLLLALPVMAIAATVLLSQSTAQRSVAGPAALAAGIAAALLIALLMGVVSAASLTLATVAVVATGLVAAPLLDRARFRGLVIAAAVGGVAITAVIIDLYARFLPQVTKPALVYGITIAAIIMGFAGSTLLPLHPARITADGIRRSDTMPGGILLVGWSLLALTLACLLWISIPRSAPFPASVIIAALTATLVALVGTRRAVVANGWQKAGEALAAGVMISSLASLAPIAALGAGWLAGFLVLRSEAMAHAIRLDDPSHLTGALLLPSLLGLLLPGLLSPPLLAANIIWIGASLALGMVSAMLLWPLAMLLFGFALPISRIKERCE